MVGALLALLGRLRKSRDLLVASAILAAFAALGGFLMQGERFTLGPIAIPSYGAMLCIALVVGWHLTLRLGEREGLSRELIVSAYFGTALCALLGARLLYVAANLHEFPGFWDALALRRGGLLAYGGLLGGLLIDRLGRKTVMVGSILMYSLSPVAAAYSMELWQLVVFRCTTFIGVCVEMVAAVTWLGPLVGL